MDNALTLLSKARRDGAGAACASGRHLHSVYCWGRFDGATVLLEASPDGEEWFVLQRITAKTSRLLRRTTPYLRGRIIGAGEASCLHLHLH